MWGFWKWLESKKESIAVVCTPYHIAHSLGRGDTNVDVVTSTLVCEWPGMWRQCFLWDLSVGHDLGAVPDPGRPQPRALVCMEIIIADKNNDKKVLWAVSTSVTARGSLQPIPHSSQSGALEYQCGCGNILRKWLLWHNLRMRLKSGS